MATLTPWEHNSTGAEEALAAVAAFAAELDANPRFPTDAFEALRDAGLTALNVPGPDGTRTISHADEWGAVRAVARADGSVGRIFDGHLNAVERLGLGAPDPLRGRELAAVAAGELLLGLWGADPAPGEGPPARLVSRGPTGAVVSGVKTFCSGAGGVQRALVLVRGKAAGPPLLAYVDLSRGVEIDRDWYRAAGMRASESHRVVFDGARVLAVLGGPGELSREPWFGRDAIRTAASWAGVADSAADSALSLLSQRENRTPLESLAAGRIAGAQATIDALLERAARRAEDAPGESQLEESVLLRAQISDASGRLLDEATRACGSRPLVTASALDRARRDLGVFLLQHRLDPLLARVGGRLLDERG